MPQPSSHILVACAVLSTCAAQQARTRTELTADVKAARESLAKTPTDSRARLRYSKLLFQSGAFAESRTALQPLIGPDAKPEILEHAAKLSYLLGDYSRAAERYRQLVAVRAGDLRGQIMAKIGLAFSHYQSNDFAKVRELDFPPGVKIPTVTLMKSFRESPYRKTWKGEGRVSTLEFLVTDPLPVVRIEVEGRSIEVLLDTGADTLIVDSEIASTLKIAPVAEALGAFGGGKQGKVRFAKVERITLGSVTLHDAPIMVLPCKRFSRVFGDKASIGGILGTSVLRQFLSTVDYAKSRLVLRDRTREHAQAIRKQLDSRLAATIPFVLDATHLMMARGGINGRAPLTFFVDSGLASEASFAAPSQTLEHAGIAIPKKTLADESVGGGGGKFASGRFEIESLRLGKLVQKDLKGEFGALTDSTYWARGYVQDGLISHGFLRRYSSWTLDFDAMEFLVER